MPIDVAIYDIQGISLIAEHSQPVSVRTTVSYKVNTSQAGQGQLNVELIQPQTSITSCRCHVHELDNQEHLIQYIPTEPGRYQLRILFNNQLVQGKTIDTDVYSLLPLPATLPSSSLARIQQVLPNNTPLIGDDICLQIITEKPSIHGQVSYNAMSVPCQIEPTKDKRIWHLKFRPYLVGIYKISVFHNGLPLTTSPYSIQVKDTNGKNPLSDRTNTPFVLKVHTDSASSSHIRAVILLGDLQIPSTITVVNDNLICIQFIPPESGLYSISVFNGDQPIKGSPFSVSVERPQVVQISGECFPRFRLNDLCIFRVHCHGQRGPINAKIFNLSIADRHAIGQMISFLLLESYEHLLQFPSQMLLTSLTILLTAQLRLTQERIRNLKLEKENGHTVVSFQLYEVPTQLPTNEQIINVLRNLIDKQIVNLIDPNRGVLHAVCGSLIIGPKGEPVNVKFFEQANGDYMGEFTPKKVGQHRIDITFANLPIKGSPFFTEVYDTSQVRISPLPTDITVGTEIIFQINFDNAGNIPLEIKISSPTSVNVPFKIDDISSTVKNVRFTPTEAGIHYLNVKFGSDIIPGTPIKMMVNNARIVNPYGDGIHHALQEKPAIFMIDSKDMSGDLKVHIEGPTSIIKNTIERINNKLFKITYIPVEVGFVHINIKWNGNDIVDSPFKVPVTNSEHVRIVGGWQSLLDSQNHMRVFVNEEKIIQFDASDAGPGTLKAEIRYVDDTHIPLRIDQKGSLYTLAFTTVREGKYNLKITYADNALPNMPIRIRASSVSSESSQVEVYGRGLHKARVNEEAEFTIDASRTPVYGNTKPTVRLTGVQTDVEVRIEQIDKNKHIFLCSYKPTIPGVYLLSIIWAERQIRDSPFKVKVLSNTEKMHSTSRVICSGDALRMGILGKEMQCVIDTRAANPGELTAYCQGINTIAFCRLSDHRDGTFTLFIKPQEIGKHLLTIKYNNENVSGSPYTVKVSGPSDASKVRVSGPGIDHGVLSSYQSNFVCHTKGAGKFRELNSFNKNSKLGAGQLTVQIQGPKGAFHVEMEREHLQDRTIVCRYDPSEPGDYLITVKWSGEHVYGSPFHTHIYENQEELDRFQKQRNSNRLIQQQ